MARKKTTNTKRPIETYEHRDKQRLNNPPVGLVTPETDPDAGQKKKTYAYDPHLDPQLVWAGKAEHTSFEVPTVSLHVHERIEPRTIIEAVRKRTAGVPPAVQLSLFESERAEPLREAIEFYRHAHGWTNRLIAGDSLLVMNSLLEKEGLAGKVQMIYIDPPYGIKYGSNFQPFVNKRDVKDGKDEDLTSEPEQIKAFRDTWELGIHSYLTYLRDRLLLARELLTESGSIFVQISDENVHHVRELMDEAFNQPDKNNFCGLIAFRTTAPLGSSGLAASCDYLLWYAKDKQRVKFRPLFVPKPMGEGTNYMWVEDEAGNRRRLAREESQKPESVVGRLFYPSDLASSGYTETCTFDFMFNAITIKAGKKSWRTTKEGVLRLIAAGRIMTLGANNRPCFIQFHADNPLQPLSNVWVDTRSAMDKKYVVETDPSVVQRCLLMTTDPGDLVFDPTCGSGTTAYVAEQWGRRWITCDTSRVALTLAKQRLMTAVFDYYELAHPEEGVGSGFRYKTVPHVTLKSIANNPEIDGIYARLHPAVEKALADLNAALKGKAICFKVTTGGRAGHVVDFAAPESQTFTMPSGQVVPANQLVEWEVPFEFPADWPETARAPFERFHQARRTLQKEIDAAIARHAPQETLYDQPFVDKKKVRVTGPFTVEAVPAPVVKSVEELVPVPQPSRLPQLSRLQAGTPTVQQKGMQAGTPTVRPHLLSGWHSRGYLPHLKMEDGIYFVTFRLADTLPQKVLEAYQAERDELLRRAKAAGCELSTADAKRLRELFSDRIEAYLNAGHGQCWLKEPSIGNMVMQALRHYDGERYTLYAFVVMPNHVHALVRPHAGFTLSQILHTWKSFTAHEAQKIAEASGLSIPKGEAFWQRESYDHLIRDEADFEQILEYIIQNPVKAGLCDKPEDWPYLGVAEVLSFGEDNVPRQAGEGADGYAGEDAYGTAERYAGEDAYGTAERYAGGDTYGTAERYAGGDAYGTAERYAGEDACGTAIARSGETLRQAEWRDELLKTGIRGKAGQYIRFSRLEPLPGCRYLHAEGETRPSAEGADTVHENAPAYEPMRVVISFGPEHAPLEQRQVERAWEEARTLVPKPKLLIFAAFQFDPEASKDIDEMKPELAGMQFLKVQMSADLLTDDLKKKRASNETFWLIGQPDVEVRRTEDGKFVVEVHGFDYYNTKTGGVESGGKDKIALWLLDTDYDGRSLYPRQVFFPMAGENEGWAKLARNLKAEIDEDLIEAYRGTVSLPFEAGEHRRIAVKIVDDRGIESLKVIELE